MRRGFSLIEIIQTVILLGIIAGLAISFLRVFDNDRRVLEATAPKLEQAIEEAGRLMCDDSTPVCESGGFNPANPCRFSTGNYVDGFCFVNRGGDQDKCPKGTKEDSYGNCYTEPWCDDEGPKDYAKPLSSLVCPNGSLNFALERDGTYSELCRRLQVLLNHKPQPPDDLRSTCFPRITYPYVNTNVVNMVLPNGIRLYNMGGNFVLESGGPDGVIGTRDDVIAHPDSTDITDKLVIYVRFDRVDEVSTINICDNAGDEDCNTVKLIISRNGKIEWVGR